METAIWIYLFFAYCAAWLVGFFQGRLYEMRRER